MSDIAIKIENLKKQYKLGAIGGQTLNAELQSWWARKRGKEDPNLKIGQDYSNFGESFYALNGINLEIKKGEALGIIGGNGAGKSTLLKILSRVTAPTEGDVWIDGRIASMLEVGTGFHGELTGRENIYMNGAILGMTKKEVDEKIESIIDFSECRQFIDTPVKRYSSGMYVKLAFAVASHLDAEIMVMDEVLAVGDMKFQKKCLGKMGDASANEGKTVLYVSHNMSTIRNLCTRCVVLQKGKLIFDGDVEQAVAIYSEGLESTETFTTLNCKNELRRNSLGRIAHINKFEFLHKELAEFESGEKIVFKIELNSIKVLEDVIGRVVIRTMDGENIAMSESPVVDIEDGDTEIKFTFDSKNLPDGMYAMIISLNEISVFGEYEMLDEIPNTIPFKIVENELFGKKKSVWISKYWGRIRLDSLEVEFV